MYGESRTTASASSGGMSTETAATSGFATITSATSLSPKTKTLSIISRSPSSICPCCVERETSIRSSASECTSRSAPGGSSPKEWRIASVAFCSSQIAGRKTAKNARTGVETQSAVPSACPSAAPFGTSSPKTTWKKLRIA